MLHDGYLPRLIDPILDQYQRQDGVYVVSITALRNYGVV